MSNPVVHFEIASEHAKELQAFYSQLFGWKVDTNNPVEYGVVETGSERGIAGGIGPAMGGPNRVTFYVEVDDLRAYLDKAVSLGGKTLMEPDAVPGGPTIAMFQDPDGNITGLTQAGQ